MRRFVLLVMCFTTAGVSRGQEWSVAEATRPPIAVSRAAAIRTYMIAPDRDRAETLAVRFDFRLHETQWPPSPVPRRGAGRTVLTFAGGLAGSVLLGWFAFGMVSDVRHNDRVKGDAGYSREANAAFILGSGLGTTLAVYTVGLKKPKPGKLTAAATGAALGTLAMLPFIDDPYLVLFGTLFGSPAQALGATIVYEESRRAASADAGTNRP